MPCGRVSHREATLHRQGRSDLGQIHASIQTDRPLAASRVLQRVRASAEQLPSHPFIGRKGTVAGTRELVVRGLPYIIVNSVEEVSAEIVVLNVVHGARRR